MFLLALVLYFLPTLGDITKVKEQKEKPKQNKNQGQTTSNRERAQNNMKFKNYMMHDAKTHMMHDLMHKNGSILSQFWKLTKKIRNWAKPPILKP